MFAVSFTTQSKYMTKNQTREKIIDSNILYAINNRLQRGDKKFIADTLGLTTQHVAETLRGVRVPPSPNVVTAAEMVIEEKRALQEKIRSNIFPA